MTKVDEGVEGEARRALPQTFFPHGAQPDVLGTHSHSRRHDESEPFR